MSVNAAHKKVVLTVQSVPRDWGALREVLHTAVGLAAGPPRHHVTVILLGDGVVHGVRGHDLPGTATYMTAARAHGIEFFVDQQGMLLRGFSEDQFRDEFKVVSRDLLLWKLGMAEVHLRI